jgi:CubicO group peptidase (beta-lactamase class C family)
MLKLHALVIASLFCGAPVSAETLPQEINEIFSWVEPDGPGCSVAVQPGGGESVTRAFGLAELKKRVPIVSDTRFDAGSVQKQFVAATILLLERDGLLSLSDDVRRHVPELPDYGVPITVDHLLTHTSGLRDWTALELFMPEGTPILDMILAQNTLNFPPGEQWSYSNSNYVLLKQIVERVTGESLAEVTQKRLFEPLGLADTAFVDDLVRVQDRALGYAESRGGWTADMRMSDDRGGGVLFTTAPDLLRWTRALPEDVLATGLNEQLTEPVELNNGRTLGYGRGLMIEAVDGTPRLVWHSGGAGGYNALAARFSKEDLAVAILCNAGDRAELTEYSRGIFEAVHGTGHELFEPEEPPAGPFAPFDVLALAGVFENGEKAQLLRIEADGEALRVFGGPEMRKVEDNGFRLAQTSLWFMSQDDPLITFVSPDLLQVTSMEGLVTQFQRVAPSTQDPEDLAQLAGSYGHADTGGVIEITAVGPVLLVKPPHLPVPVPLEAVASRIYAAGPFTLTFSKGEKGSEPYIDLDLPLLRNLRFQRLAL